MLSFNTTYCLLLWPKHLKWTFKDGNLKYLTGTSCCLPFMAVASRCSQQWRCNCSLLKRLLWLRCLTEMLLSRFCRGILGPALRVDVTLTPRTELSSSAFHGNHIPWWLRPLAARRFWQRNNGSASVSSSKVFHGHLLTLHHSHTHTFIPITQYLHTMVYFLNKPRMTVKGSLFPFIVAHK